jgi:large subunit ribosomal protein L13Ae
MFEKVVIIDGKGHLIGRLASVLAKELLNGQKVVVVRCEEIQISGSLFRNQLIFSKFLQHRGNTNPKRGPIHYRSPARILWRTIRGMMPHKKERGQAALERLKVFEGIPHPYDRMKRVVVPAALRVLRLKPGRKYCRLGDLASSVGWAHNGLIKKLETKRITVSSAYYLRKKQLALLKKKAIANLGAKLGGGGGGGGSPSAVETSDKPKEQKKPSVAPKKEKPTEKKPSEKKAEKTDKKPEKTDKKPEKTEKTDKKPTEKKEGAAPEKEKKPAKKPAVAKGKPKDADAEVLDD